MIIIKEISLLQEEKMKNIDQTSETNITESRHDCVSIKDAIIGNFTELFRCRSYDYENIYW